MLYLPLLPVSYFRAFALYLARFNQVLFVFHMFASKSDKVSWLSGSVTAFVGKGSGFGSCIRSPCLIVLHLSLPTFHFRGRKNEYSAQRG